MVDLLCFVIACLLMGRVPGEAACAGEGNGEDGVSAWLRSLREGLQFIRTSKPLLLIASTAAFLNAALTPCNALQAALFQDVYRKGSGALSAMGICTTVGMLLGAGLYSAAAGGRNESKEGKVSIDRILLGCGILMGSYYLVLAWLGLEHPVDAVFYPVLFTASLLFGVSVGLANTAVSVLLLRVVPTSYMARASAVMNAGCTAAVPLTSFLVSGVCARASVVSVLAGTAVPVFVVSVVLMGKGTLKRLNDFGQEKDGGLRDTDNQDRCEKRKGRAGDAD